jgi:hypothetical protein
MSRKLVDVAVSEQILKFTLTYLYSITYVGTSPGFHRDGSSAGFSLRPLDVGKA